MINNWFKFYSNIQVNISIYMNNQQHLHNCIVNNETMKKKQRNLNMSKFSHFYSSNIYNTYAYIILWNLWDYCCFQGNFAIFFKLFNVIYFTTFCIVIQILSYVEFMGLLLLLGKFCYYFQIIQCNIFHSIWYCKSEY